MVTTMRILSAISSTHAPAAAVGGEHGIDAFAFGDPSDHHDDHDRPIPRPDAIQRSPRKFGCGRSDVRSGAPISIGISQEAEQ